MSTMQHRENNENTLRPRDGLRSVGKTVFNCLAISKRVSLISLHPSILEFPEFRRFLDEFLVWSMRLFFLEYLFMTICIAVDMTTRPSPKMMTS